MRYQSSDKKGFVVKVVLAVAVLICVCMGFYHTSPTVEHVEKVIPNGAQM